MTVSDENPTIVRGWCPGAHRPMMSGDGPVVRIRPRLARLTRDQALGLCDVAEEFGSGNPAKPENLATRKDERGPMLPGELQTAMIPRRTRDGRVVCTGRGVVPGAADTYVAYGREWANASNTPFRLYKHWVHEGGISSPLIVHWGKSTKAVCVRPFVKFLRVTLEPIPMTLTSGEKNQPLHVSANMALLVCWTLSP